MARREYQNPPLRVRESVRGPEYYIRYRVRVLEAQNGAPAVVRKQKTHAIGLCDEMTESQAQRQRAAILAEVNGQVFSLKAMMPFADLVTMFRQIALPELAVPTQATYDQWLRNYIEPYFRNRTLNSIGPVDISGFMGSIRELAPTTQNAIRGVLASLWKRAKEWGYWNGESPLKSTSGRKRSLRKRERRIWTPEQLDMILDAVRQDVRLIIETLTWTGMRISECLGLTPEMSEDHYCYLLVIAGHVVRGLQIGLLVVVGFIAGYVYREARSAQ